jgi:hypothetical protein
MALATCSDLKSAVATWLARSGDTQITSNVSDFIEMAEAHINRNLRVRQMETVQTFMTTSGVANLADDYLAWKRMTWLGDTYVSLEYVTPDMLNRAHPAVEDGIPSLFTIQGSDIIIRPTDDTTNFEFLYYAKLTALSADGDTNWLLDQNPDLYLAATLAEANAFLINPDHASLWAAKRDNIIDQMSRLSEKTKGPSRIIPIGTWY